MDDEMLTVFEVVWPLDAMPDTVEIELPSLRKLPQHFIAAEKQCFHSEGKMDAGQ